MLKFRPILKSVIWGGEKIAPYKGISTDLHRIGESWELSGLAGNVSVVAGGPDHGRPLSELLARDGERLLGRRNFARFGTEFPLLVKFIDARRDLSIQVHPGDALAQELHGARNGKTEMWYVVSADPDARLKVGFRREVTPEEYEAAVAGHTIAELLAEYRIAPGDLFFLPAGRVHTIGAGSFLVEIQQSSDITYRIYDYGRLGSDGRPRELHTELAKQAIDFSVQADYRTPYVAARDCAVPLVHCDCFTSMLFDLTAPQTFDLDRLDSFVVVICTDGCGTLVDDRGERMPIHRGETVLLPATTRCLTFEPAAPAFKLLTAWIDDPE